MCLGALHVRIEGVSLTGPLSKQRETQQLRTCSWEWMQPVVVSLCLCMAKGLGDKVEAVKALGCS